MAPNIAQSGTAGRHVWYTGDDRGSSPHMRSFSFSVLATGGSHDVEADHGHDGRTGLLLAAALVACGAPAPSDLTLLVFRRSPAASLGGLSWAPDPDNSRLVAFDARLRVARSVTSSRLANPMAVATLGTALLVTERTGEGIVLDTTGRPVREWESPNPASLYAAGGGTVVAVRSPYYIPQFTAEPDTAPLIRILDTLGKPVAGLATIHLPPVPFLAQLANAGAVAVGSDGSVYFAPLVRDEIRKYSAGGTLRWTAKRGLFRTEADPEFLPAQGRV